MAKRLRYLGIVTALFGVVFVVMGFYGLTQVMAGQDSLEAFSKAQNVNLSYNEDGELVDRGETAGADAIMKLLTDDWGYAAKEADLDPDDKLVDTPTEYMYQMATVAYHTLHSTQTVELPKDVEFEGQTYKAGKYDFDVDGRYWTGFNRQHPLEGPAREKAWTGTAHGLIAELGVGAVTASTLQLGSAVSLMNLALGAALFVLGCGFVWAMRTAA
jgi:hypothetical protein